VKQRGWLLTLAYDGTDYCGWQRQENGPSVAAALEAVLEKICGETVVAHGSSRTDAGVHAEGQRARVTLPAPWHGWELQRSLNSLLPPAIRVMALHACPEEFNPRIASIRKHYRYQWAWGPACSPFHAATHEPVRKPLDVAAMRDAAARYLGKHDFSAFRGVSGLGRNPLRTIEESTLVQPAPGILHYRVAGPGFMHQQVRIMAGTLLEVGAGARGAESVSELLASGAAGARDQAGHTAPARGLVLERIDFADRP